MNQYAHDNDYFAAAPDLFAAAAAADIRTSFITRTYTHLIGAILALIALDFVAFQIWAPQEIAQLMMGTPVSWIVVMGLFMAASWIANTWANSDTSSSLQYMGLGLYIVIEAIILLPLLSLAYMVLPPDQASQTIWTAGIGTGALFAMMTLAVFITRQDFSFLRTALWFGSFAIIGIAVLSAFVGFHLGPIVIYFGIALACGYILYDTSNVMLHYRPNQHVAAALALFAAVMLLFWYVLQLLIHLSRE